MTTVEAISCGNGTATPSGGAVVTPLSRVFIYTLSDPVTKLVRYVGKTTDLVARFNDHCKSQSRTYKGNWIKSLLKRGLKPEMEILEELTNQPDKDWQEAERFWIETLRFYGCKLTNQTKGGVGGTVSKEALEKIRRALCGRKLSPEHIAKLRAVKPSPESRARAVRTTRERGGYHISPELRKKLSEIHKGLPKRPKGYKHTAESRLKMSLAMKGKHKGRKLTEAHKAAIRASSGGWHQTDEVKARLSLARKGTPWTQKAREAFMKSKRRRCNREFGQQLALL